MRERVCVDEDSAESSAKHSPQNSWVQLRRTTLSVLLSSSRHTGHSLRSFSDGASVRPRFLRGSRSTAAPLVSCSRSSQRRFDHALSGGAARRHEGPVTRQRDEVACTMVAPLAASVLDRPMAVDSRHNDAPRGLLDRKAYARPDVDSTLMREAVLLMPRLRLLFW
eukprot:CAMPEP_0185690802 /NCGR_PEP_ID=MMETSP1164-20130828/1371_1 /TAXON_ID=1104430 /ORGANISM="Chrysoreinhardia sp, Strain CCMP2950" /LENGTH=165 /DNA_ID=CAMNT_0028357405 /DNA_START=171 /DNA_END=664 /DNA_ORIENTATION=+